MIVEQELTQQVACRLGELFAVRAAWQRRLWAVGTPLALRELAEACAAAADGSLSEPSVRWFADRLHGQVGRDPGVGGSEQLRQLRKCLHSDLRAGGLAQRMLEQIADDVHRFYLERWASALEQPDHGFRAERIARAAASYLLDRGMSQNYLHRTLVYLRDHDARDHDLPSLLRALDGAASHRPRAFTVFVPMLNAFPAESAEPAEWLRAGRAAAWLIQAGLDKLMGASDLAGAFLLRIHATDPEAAVERAAEMVAAVSGRAAVGTRSTLEPGPDALVKGEEHRFPLIRSRRVEVRTLGRQGLIGSDLSAAGSAMLDGALQLLAHLDVGPPEAAVAGGWSAIETLLTGPGDRANVEAADRLATLVACSWPRAELTTLAWDRIELRDDDLSGQLRALANNRERAEFLGARIASGTPLDLPELESRCAIRRMEKLYRSPKAVLKDVEAYAKDAFRRLYRSRNLVLHGGNTRGVALLPGLRTAAQLVGAGVDRIVHGFLVNGQHPLDLAALARLRLETVEETNVPLTRLLDP